MSDLQRISITIEQSLTDQFDGLLARKGYATRSEAVRDLIRKALVEDQWQQDDAETVGTLTVVYDHTKPEVSQQFIHAGHEQPGLVLATLHIHMTHENCLEVMALKGKSSQVRHFADMALSAKGVKHGDLVMTTMGCDV